MASIMSRANCSLPGGPKSLSRKPTCAAPCPSASPTARPRVSVSSPHLLIAKQCHDLSVLFFEHELLVRAADDLIVPRLLHLHARLVGLCDPDAKPVAVQLPDATCNKSSGYLLPFDLGGNGLSEKQQGRVVLKLA